MYGVAAHGSGRWSAAARIMSASGTAPAVSRGAPDGPAGAGPAVGRRSSPAPLLVRACVITSPEQVAYRLLGRRRRLHHRQQPRPVRLRQLPRVPPVGLDPVARLARHRHRRSHLALDPAHFELPLQRVAARSGLVAARDGPGAARSSFRRSRSTARASFRTVQVTGVVASGASIATCNSHRSPRGW